MCLLGTCTMRRRNTSVDGRPAVLSQRLPRGHSLLPPRPLCSLLPHKPAARPSLIRLAASPQPGNPRSPGQEDTRTRQSPPDQDDPLMAAQPWQERPPSTPHISQELSPSEATQADPGESAGPADGGGGIPGPALPDDDPAHPPHPTPSSNTIQQPLPSVKPPMIMTPNAARRVLGRGPDGLPAAGIYITTVLTCVAILAASIGNLHAAPMATMLPFMPRGLDTLDHPLSVQASLRAAAGLANAAHQRDAVTAHDAVLSGRQEAPHVSVSGGGGGGGGDGVVGVHVQPCATEAAPV